jgi:prevent-host-death family protein
MYVSATEFKAKLGKYMDIAEKEEVIITRRGKPDMYLGQQPKKTRAELVEALFGTLPKEAQNETQESIREGRLRERGCID